MSFLTNAVNRISEAVDHVQDLAADNIPPLLQPGVHKTIDGRVDAFRDSTLAEIPKSCEDNLKQQAGEHRTTAWLFEKVLGDNTDVLVAKLVEVFRPGVTNATDGLSTRATDLILDKLKDMLDSQSSDDEEEGGGSGSRLAKAVSGAVAGSFKLDGKMPSFEAVARETAHPLFEELKLSIWELVPSTVKESVGGLIGDKPEAVAEEGEEPPPAEEGGGGLGSWFENRAGKAVAKFMDVASGALEGPVRSLINKLVDDLEESAMAAALKEIREKLASWHLVSSA